MNSCYVCGATLAAPIYTSNGHGSMTTMLKLYDAPTVVSFCDHCGHLQTKAIVDPDDYYAHQYSILTKTDDEDLLYKVVDGRRIFQVEHRVATLLAKLLIPPGAEVLDYGCAKGSVARRLHQLRPDITPYFFEVTDRYVPFWGQTAQPTQWAVGAAPQEWTERFDAVCSFYVLEHVADPVATVAGMARLIRPDGFFYAIVPNALANSADLIVADHLQHFSENSWHETLRRAGLSIAEIDDQSHESALIVVAQKILGSDRYRNPKRKRGTRIDAAASLAYASGYDQQVAEGTYSTSELRRRYEGMSAFWSELANRVRSFERSSAADREACIYGAGFYGNFIASCLDNPSGVTCFVDQNPHLTGRTMLGKPIIAPPDLAADIQVLYAGLNPSIARDVLADIRCFRDRSLEVFYL